MLKAAVTATAAAREACFRRQFAWQGSDRHPYWAIVGGAGCVYTAIPTAVRRTMGHCRRS